MTERPVSFRRLSEAEALRALYIDFEGEKGKPPVLLGVHRRGRGAKPYVRVHVLDEAFADPAEPAVSLRGSVANVVSRAEHGDRRIASWSEHDLRVVRTLTDKAPDLVARFDAQYANALGVAPSPHPANVAASAKTRAACLSRPIVPTSRGRVYWPGSTSPDRHHLSGSSCGPALR